jgi:ABC-type sugar transport system ATPase subunit
MTVRDNLAFGLRRRGIDAAEIARRVNDVGTMLGLQPLLARKPYALSGGQRQRVALGRAIVRDPKVFLFDEPLSNLDASLRVSTRGELIKLHRRLGATMIYVTHDQVEAMTMADRIVVLRAGVIEQVGAPLELYNQPRNTFVAGFIGSPRMNFVAGRIARATETEIDLESAVLGTLTLPRDGRAVEAGQPVSFGVRPEHLELAGEGGNAWRVQVDVIEQHGSSTYLHCSAGDVELLLHVPGQGTQRAGESLHVRPAPGQWHLFGADEQRIAGPQGASRGAERRP